MSRPILLPKRTIITPAAAGGKPPSQLGGSQNSSLPQLQLASSSLTALPMAPPMDPAQAVLADVMRMAQRELTVLERSVRQAIESEEASVRLTITAWCSNVSPAPRPPPPSRESYPAVGRDDGSPLLKVHRSESPRTAWESTINAVGGSRCPVDGALKVKDLEGDLVRRARDGVLRLVDHGCRRLVQDTTPELRGGVLVAVALRLVSASCEACSQSRWADSDMDKLGAIIAAVAELVSCDTTSLNTFTANFVGGEAETRGSAVVPFDSDAAWVKGLLTHRTAVKTMFQKPIVWRLCTPLAAAEEQTHRRHVDRLRAAVSRFMTVMVAETTRNRPPQWVSDELKSVCMSACTEATPESATLWITAMGSEACSPWAVALTQLLLTGLRTAGVSRPCAPPWLDLVRRVSAAFKSAVLCGPGREAWRRAEVVNAANVCFLLSQLAAIIMRGTACKCTVDGCVRDCDERRAQAVHHVADALLSASDASASRVIDVVESDLMCIGHYLAAAKEKGLVPQLPTTTIDVLRSSCRWEARLANAMAGKSSKP